jgi:hypothetical protein
MRSIKFLAVAVLAVVAFSSVVHAADAQGVKWDIYSLGTQTSYKGYVCFYFPGYPTFWHCLNPQATVIDGLGVWGLRFYATRPTDPDFVCSGCWSSDCVGCTFSHWESSGPACVIADVSSRETTVTCVVGDCVISAYYVDPSAPSVPVGGVVMPVNKLAVFAPYLALFGLVAAVAVVIAKPRKKPENRESLFPFHFASTGRVW